MTTSIPTSNPLVAGTPAPGAAGAVSSLRPPTEAQARVAPAGLAGATGLSPEPLVTAPSAESAAPFYYFLESARPTSPQAVPASNLAPPSLDPVLRGSIVPATATAADPRGLPGRTALPGQHLGSTAPATPPVELGAQIFAPAVPPASSFGLPKEQQLRGAPAALSGAAGTSLQPAVTTPGFAEPSSYPAGANPGGSLYFVEEALAFAKAPTGLANVGSGAGVLPEIVPAPFPTKA